jgi:hypothetical protein
MLYFLIIKC